MTVVHSDTDLEYWARDYWLGHCEGFRVVDEDQRLGFVDEDEPEELVVRGGLFANRTYRISVEAVLTIEPRTERVVLRPDRELAR
ncbi:MAG: hypothetical protein ACRDM2_03555 [Gaiellaceae bacterium]